MKALALAIALLTPVACAATDISRDGSTEARAIIMRGSLISFENAAYRIIRQRYPDAKRPPIKRAVTFDGHTYIAKVVFDTFSDGLHTMYFDITHVN
jgi:hypothetical protein